MKTDSIPTVLTAYLEHLKGRDLCIKTVSRRRSVIINFLFDNAITAPEEILPEHLHRHQETLPLCNIGISTQRFNLASIKDFLRYLRDRNLILTDVDAHIQLPRLGKPLPRIVLTQDEMSALLGLDLLDTDLQLRALVELLYGTGIRRSELRNLDLYDLDLQKRVIFIRNGKGKKDRMIPVLKKTVGHLRTYIRATSKQREDSALFIGVHGRRLIPSQLDKAMHTLKDAARREAQITKRITCHIFRHSIATHLLECGLDIRYVQAFLGHEKLETTQIYTHVATSHLAAELKRCHPREKMKLPLHT